MIRTLRVESREAWREWLARNHDSEKEIWLVFPKRHTGRSGVEYEHAIEEALCFGWVDSLVRRLDEDEYARKFTPRRAGSVWSELNRKRYAKVLRLGIVTGAGLALAPPRRSPQEVSAAARARAPAEVPDYIRSAIAANSEAARNFARSAPSVRRLYVRWIDSAKRPETRRRRLAEAIGRLERNLPLGLK